MNDDARNKDFSVTVTRASRFQWKTSLHHRGQAAWIGFEGPRFFTRARAERWGKRWIAKQRRIAQWDGASVEVSGDPS